MSFPLLSPSGSSFLDLLALDMDLRDEGSNPDLWTSPQNSEQILGANSELEEGGGGFPSPCMFKSSGASCSPVVFVNSYANASVS